MNSNETNTISNNFNGIQSTEKGLKLIQYFKNKLLSHRILFLWEINSTESTEASWQKEFNATLFLSHALSNSCWILIGLWGQYDVNVLNQISDNKGHILILNVTIDAKIFVMINSYNPNTENKQIEVLNALLTIMKTTGIKENSNLFLARVFNVLF